MRSTALLAALLSATVLASPIAKRQEDASASASSAAFPTWWRFGPGPLPWGGPAPSGAPHAHSMTGTGSGPRPTGHESRVHTRHSMTGTGDSAPSPTAAPSDSYSLSSTDIGAFPSTYSDGGSGISSAPAASSTVSENIVVAVTPKPAPAQYSSSTSSKAAKKTRTRTESESTYAAAPQTSTSAVAAPSSTSSAAAPSSTSSSDSYIELTLAHHNVHRANHSAPALTWDTKLAQIANDEASVCIYAHNTTGGGGGYGQNIAAGVTDMGVIISDLMYNGEVNSFLPSYYGEANPSMDNFESWGHFSQIVWAATTHVGCATVKCSQGLANTGSDVSPYFTVCNYSPPGNMGGEYTNVQKSLGKATVTSAWDGKGEEEGSTY